MTAGVWRTLCGQRLNRFCRHGRSTRWAAITRECRTVRQWMRSSSCYAPGVIGIPCARPVSARHPQRIGAFRNGSRRACSQRSGAPGCWPMTRCTALTGPGWRWTGRWVRRRWVGKKTGRNPTDRGKRGVKRSLLTDGRGVPLGAAIDGANRNDHKLMRPTLEAIPVRRPRPTRRRPQHLCPDKGFDYDEPRALAQEFGFTLHLRTRGEEARAKRRARARARRWVVERTHSWLHRFRSILIRWAKKPSNYLGLLHFALALITWQGHSVLIMRSRGRAAGRS